MLYSGTFPGIRQNTPRGPGRVSAWSYGHIVRGCILGKRAFHDSTLEVEKKSWTHSGAWGNSWHFDVIFKYIFTINVKSSSMEITLIYIYILGSPFWSVNIGPATDPVLVQHLSITLTIKDLKSIVEYYDTRSKCVKPMSHRSGSKSCHKLWSYRLDRISYIHVLIYIQINEHKINYS